MKKTLNILRYPSTETQSQAAAFSFAYLPLDIYSFATGHSRIGFVLLFLVLTAAFIAIYKLRYEKRHSLFFSTALSISIDDVYDNSKKLIIRRGESLICEVHLVSRLFTMAKLARGGKVGKLRIYLDMYQGLQDVKKDLLQNPKFKDVTYITGRSDLARKFLDVGFSEIKNPPRIDILTTGIRFLMQLTLTLLMKNNRIHPPKKLLLAVISKEDFLSDKFQNNLQNEIDSLKRTIKELSGDKEVVLAL